MTTSRWARPWSPLWMPARGYAGVIATTTAETAGAGKRVADGYTVGNADVTLNGGRGRLL